MSVDPGYSGQTFLPEVLPKVSALRKMVHKIAHPIRLEIDGGINPDTIVEARQAGADTFVAASAIFHHPDGIAAGIQQLRDCLAS
jgi:ribulose-phosphate 3-epimerase